MKVLSFHQTAYLVPKGARRIDRTSNYGNPYPMHAQTWEERMRVIEEFRIYAQKRLKKEPNWLKPLWDRDLVCWCAPLPCHGDVIMKLLHKKEKA